MSTYSTSSIPQGIQIYANATLFPVTAQDGEQAVAADTNTLYIYDTSIPGWQAVANPGAAIAIDALTGDVTATGPGVVAATIANAAVTNAKLAAMADNTVKGNKSGAPASPSDLTLSNLTESTSNVLTITNGSKAIIATSDLTIQVKQSGAAQDGYLSSSDWSSFNAKLVSINGDTTPAQTISAGTGISVGTAAGVTTVTNTAPMAATGNLTEATSSVLTISGGTGAVIGAGGTTIQVLQSGAAQSGYLSSGDWSTFNSKVSSVSGSAPVSSSGGTTPTISITQSGAATDGYLSSTDWNTFNNKQPAGTYVTSVGATSPVASSGGTTPTISMPVATALADGYLSSANFTTFNNAASSVAAATAISTPSTLMARDASGETALDGLSLDGSTSGAIKLQAAATTTSYTVKMPSAQGAASTFLQNDGSGNLSWTAVPSPYPAYSSDKVLYSTASAAEWRTVGLGSSDAGYPSNTVILGRGLPTSMTATNGVLIGVGANLGTGTNQVIIGYNSGRSTVGATGAGNTVIGADSFNSASLTTAFDNVVIGKGAGKAITTAQQYIIIGAGCGTGVTGSYQSVLIGNHSSGSYNGIVSVGWQGSVTGDSAVRVGFRGSATTNGVSVGDLATAASNGTALGTFAYASADSTALGISASCFGATRSVSVGANAKTVNAIESVAIGYLAGGDSNGTGNYNTSLGSYAGGLLTSTSARNVFLGRYSGYRSTTQADELFIDNQDRTTYANQQTNSLIYGAFNATPASQTLKVNAALTSTYGFVANEIGGDYDTRIEGDTDANLIFVDASTDRVGIGLNNPSAKLEVSGDSQLNGALVVNEAGADKDTRIEGDTDANLVFVDASTDRVGIGTATPAEKLEVNGNVLASELAVANYKVSPKHHDEGTETTNFTINWANSPVQTVTINAAGPLVATFQNPVQGGAYAIRIIQGATPGTITWPTNVKWPTNGTGPTLSTSTGEVDIVNFLYIDDGGGNTYYYGTFATDFA